MGKSKQVANIIKLQIGAGKANPAPPVGPALGQAGVNIKEFTDQFNAATKDLQPGMPTPTVITVYADRSFTFITKTPPASYLILQAIKKKKGASNTGKEIIAWITKDQLRKIAEIKMKDLNANDEEAAIKMLAGSARSMGIEVKD